MAGVSSVVGHAQETDPMAESKAKQAKTGPAAVNMRGLKCPLPALKTRKLLAKMAPGEVLVIECTDPLTAIDIPNLLRQTGDSLVSDRKQGRVRTFGVRKA